METSERNKRKVELTFCHESENKKMKSFHSISFNGDVSSAFHIQVDRNDGLASLETEVIPLGGTEATLQVLAVPKGEVKEHGKPGFVKVQHKDVPPNEKPSQGKICVASRNTTYAQIVCTKLNDTVLKAYFGGHMEVCPKKIESDYQFSLGAIFKRENFDGAHLVMFVATAEPRMLLISKNEESQLGVIYQQACRCKCSVFLLIVGHSDSDNLSDTELYHKDSLDEVIEDQPALKELRDQGQIASLGYCCNPDELEFNTKQSDAIRQWIDRSGKSSM